MTNKIVEDPRIDPRIKSVFADVKASGGRKVARREDLLAAMAAAAAAPQDNTFGAVLENQDFEAIAPSTGLEISSRQITSSPEGNAISLQVIRPQSAEPLPCVYYIHGGGMMMMSAYDPHFTAWGRMIAARGVAVVLVEFRNAGIANTLPEIAPYPAGLNDCVSGLRWVLDNAGELGIDPERVVVAGESGGGNLTIAAGLAMKRDGQADRIKGLYALCPYIRGDWSEADGGSVMQNSGILIDLLVDNGAVCYGIDAFEARDPLAWPGFASEEDLKGLPKVKISVNECDPLMDEGITLYRKLLRAGVAARCQIAVGTIHGTESFLFCSDISESMAVDIAAFARD
ncbi:MAG: alpha/beta hydrolase [Sphingomonadaceae bacterium]|nr:alpha/beta hydrolase [Sphingomonadaceae bacterium]